MEGAPPYRRAVPLFLLWAAASAFMPGLICLAIAIEHSDPAVVPSPRFALQFGAFVIASWLALVVLAWRAVRGHAAPLAAFVGLPFLPALATMPYATWVLSGARDSTEVARVSYTVLASEVGLVFAAWTWGSLPLLCVAIAFAAPTPTLPGPVLPPARGGLLRVGLLFLAISLAWGIAGSDEDGSAWRFLSAPLAVGVVSVMAIARRIDRVSPPAQLLLVGVPFVVGALPAASVLRAWTFVLGPGLYDVTWLVQAEHDVARPHVAAIALVFAAVVVAAPRLASSASSGHTWLALLPVTAMGLVFVVAFGSLHAQVVAAHARFAPYDPFWRFVRVERPAMDDLKTQRLDTRRALVIGRDGLLLYDDTAGERPPVPFDPSLLTREPGVVIARREEGARQMAAAYGRDPRHEGADFVLDVDRRTTVRALFGATAPIGDRPGGVKLQIAGHPRQEPRQRPEPHLLRAAMVVYVPTREVHLLPSLSGWPQVLSSRRAVALLLEGDHAVATSIPETSSALRWSLDRSRRPDKPSRARELDAFDASEVIASCPPDWTVESLMEALDILGIPSVVLTPDRDTIARWVRLAETPSSPGRRAPE